MLLILETLQDFFFADLEQEEQEKARGATKAHSSSDVSVSPGAFQNWGRSAAGSAIPPSETYDAALFGGASAAASPSVFEQWRRRRKLVTLLLQVLTRIRPPARYCIQPSRPPPALLSVRSCSDPCCSHLLVTLLLLQHFARRATHRDLSAFLVTLGCSVEQAVGKDQGGEAFEDAGEEHI